SLQLSLQGRNRKVRPKSQQCHRSLLFSFVVIVSGISIFLKADLDSQQHHRFANAKFEPGFVSKLLGTAPQRTSH
ncbi:MAG: hypothetical protein ACLQU2_05715, partial [Candidatus Binataceae bacterium]